MQGLNSKVTTKLSYDIINSFYGKFGRAWGEVGMNSTMRDETIKDTEMKVKSDWKPTRNAQRSNLSKNIPRKQGTSTLTTR